MRSLGDLVELERVFRGSRGIDVLRSRRDVAVEDLNLVELVGCRDVELGELTKLCPSSR